MYDLSDICSLCLIRTQNLKCILSPDTDITVVETLKIILLEVVHFKPNIPKYICKNCIDILNNIHGFRLQCLKNITVLEQYIEELEVSKNVSVPELLNINVKEEPLELENQNDDETCETEMEDNCQQEHVAVESVFIKDEIDETNMFLPETTNTMQENNESSSQDVTKREIEETKNSTRENYVDQEHGNEFNNVQGSYEVFAKFNEEKHIENMDVTSDNISPPNKNPKNCIKKQYKCKVCQTTFPDPIDLRRHSIIHSELPFKCPICRKCFKLRQQLELHQSGKQSCKPFPLHYKCTECNKKFAQAHRLQTHMREHSDVGPYSCTICPISFKLQSDLQEHFSIHSAQRDHMCHVCDMKYLTNNHLQRHIRICHNVISDYKCAECNETCITQSDLDKHMNTAHNLEKHNLTYLPDPPPNLHECTVCQKMLPSLDALENHSKLHTGERKFECEICYKTFKRIHHFKEHSATHTGENSHVCDVCNKTFFYKNQLVKHVEVVHNNIRNYKCTECSKTFVRAIDLKAHQRIHTGEKPYKCNTCDKAFTLPQTLKRHMLQHVPNRDEVHPKQHKCVVCEKGFTSQHELKIHSSSHSEERPHECPICHKSFKLPKHLKVHLRMHEKSSEKLDV